MSAMRHDMTLMITTESLVYGTFVVDDGHRIVSWNEAATRTLGYDADATLGRTCEEMLALLCAQDVAICPEVIHAPRATTAYTSPIDPHLLRQRQDEPVELRVVTRHGAARWLSLSVVRARTLDGASCVVHVFHDVTTEHAEQQGHREVAAQVARHPATIVHLPLSASNADNGDYAMKMTPEHLTPREHEVLELLAQGMATVEIATALGISRVTARNHVTRVIEKIGVKTRLQAVLAASRLGLL